METTIIIPALNPDYKLIKLVENLKNKGFNHIIIIDDGSGYEYAEIFEKLTLHYKCDLIRHPENFGKGMALKRGLEYALNTYPEDIGCITVDADGQHAITDVIRISKALMYQGNTLILGVRKFGDHTPFKSKFGNYFTAALFRIMTRRVINDTQTGLRGIPKELISTFVTVSGSRYEYEINVLLEAVKRQIPFYEVEIETIFLDENKGSHFRAISDSIRIIREILSFALSGGLSAIIDVVGFAILSQIFLVNHLFIANIIARMISGIFNFMMNQNIVFESKEHPKDKFKGKSQNAAIKYGILFMVQLIISSTLVSVLSSITGMPILTKLLTDFTLFFLSYYIQKHFVFRRLSLTGEKR